MDNTDSIDDPAAEVTRLLDKLGNGDAEAMERFAGWMRRAKPN